MANTNVDQPIALAPACAGRLAGRSRHRAVNPLEPLRL